MEEFFDIILIAALILVMIFGGAVIYFLIENPRIAYLLIAGFVLLVGTGSGLWIRKISRKKRLGQYYELSGDISQKYRNIQRALKTLDRPSRNILSAYIPKIRKLYEETQRCLVRVVEIDRALETLDHKETQEKERSIRPWSPRQRRGAKMRASDHRYSENIQVIQQSKSQHLQEIQQVIRCFDELNSQILALKYAPLSSNMGVTISDTLDELLIDIQALHEVS